MLRNAFCLKVYISNNINSCVCVSICMYLYICHSTYLSLYPSSTYFFITYLSFIYLSLHLFIHPSIDHLPISLYLLYLSIYISIYRIPSRVTPTLFCYYFPGLSSHNLFLLTFMCPFIIYLPFANYMQLGVLVQSEHLCL